MPAGKEMPMARYLIQASYTRGAIQGVMKKGGSGRREAIGKLRADLGVPPSRSTPRSRRPTRT
jgi:hypothetical protein